MSINKKRESGFTIVEITVAMGLMAIGGTALMAAADYFSKASAEIESKAAHTALRNLVQMTLSQREKKCPGGGAPCTTVNQCGTKLQGKAGGAAQIPMMIGVNAPITPAENVELAITNGVNGNVVTSGMIRDRLEYQVLLTGKPKSTFADGSVLYAGAVQIVGKRKFFVGQTSYTAEVPIDFTVSTAGAVTDCTTRPSEQVIAGGKNDVNSCLDAGGVSVSTSIGTMCRFSSSPSLSDISGDEVCPDGFIGDPTTGCTLDMTADSPLLVMIPPCPKVSAPSSGCANGEYLSGGKCASCTTPSVPGGSGVSYNSGGDRSASTDCEVASIGSCGGLKNIGNACVPTDCNLSASLSASSPTGLSPNSGSITVSFSGVKPDTVVYVMPSPLPSPDPSSTPSPVPSIIPSKPATASINPGGGSVSSGGSSFTYSGLSQGNYSVTVTDPNIAGGGCSITLQKTFRLDGFYPDPVQKQGSLYCNYQGYPGGVPAPPCPDDPEWDPSEPPRIGWYDAVTWTPSSNLRACRYTFTCDVPDKLVVLAPPVGDGVTPSCYRQITACPNSDPPASPGPWKEISSSPLTCVSTKTAPLPPPPLLCSNFAGFSEIPASVLAAHPDLSQWMTTTPAVPVKKVLTIYGSKTTQQAIPAIQHVLCL